MIFRKKNERLLDEMHPVVCWEKNKIVLTDGRVAVGFEVESLELEQAESGEYDTLKSFLTMQAAKLEVGSVVQKIDIFFNTQYETNLKDKEYFEARALEQFVARPMLGHKSYIYIIQPSPKPGKLNPLNSFFARAKSAMENPLVGIEERLEAAEKAAVGFVDSVQSSSNVKFTRLDDKANKQLYRQCFNQEFDSEQSGYKNTYTNNSDNLTIGNKKINIVTLHEQGETVYNSVINEGTGLTYDFPHPVMLNLDFAHTVVQSITIEDTEKELNSIGIEKRVLALGIGFNREDQSIRLAGLNEFTQHIRATGKKLVTLNFHVVVPSTSDKNRDKKLRAVTNALESMGGCKGLVESWDNAAMFFGCLPGNAGQLYRGLLMPTENAFCYFNFTTNYKSKEGDILVTDRYRNPFFLNFDNYNLVNKNGFVLGPSGSGKSFQVGYFLHAQYNAGNRIIIIDKDGSYKRLVAAYKGKYIEIRDDEKDNPLSFNPFFATKTGDKYILEDEKRIFLISLIKIVYNKQVDNVWETILEEILNQYYDQEVDAPGFNRFYEFFQKLHQKKKDEKDIEWIIKLQHFEADGLLIALSRYYIGGAFEHLFNSKESVDISDHRLICFDMAGIIGNETLYKIVNLIITELTTDIFIKYPDDEKKLYIDEAWSMLEGNGEFIENKFRTIRKMKGSIWIITQGVTELENSSIAGALLANSEIKMILKPKKTEDRDKIIEYFKMDAHRAGKLMSLTGSKDHREFYLELGDFCYVFAVEAPKQFHAIITSEPNERNHYIKLVKQYQDEIMAAEIFARDKEQENIG